MRWILPLLAAAFVSLTVPASAGPFVLVGVVANDTGGIIPWSPENYRFRHSIASAYCGRYFKYARITSVRARYGDYIGFVCRRVWPPRPPVLYVRKPAVQVTK